MKNEPKCESMSMYKMWDTLTITRTSVNTMGWLTLIWKEESVQSFSDCFILFSEIQKGCMRGTEEFLCQFCEGQDVSKHLKETGHSPYSREISCLFMYAVLYVYSFLLFGQG